MTEILNDANTSFAIANAAQLILSVIACMLLSVYIYSQIESIPDFLIRTKKALTWDYQGGSYDWAVAMCLIFFGNAIRGEVSWEWRTFGTELRTWQLILGVTIAVIGLLCLVRVMVPARMFPTCWVLTLFVTLGFCILSAIIA